MADEIANSNSRWLDRRSKALLALVIAFALFDFFSSGFSGPVEWSRRILIGVWFSQAILLGAWAAIGPPPAVKRVPLTVITLLVLATASSFNQPGNFRFLEGCYIMLGLFGGAAICTRAVGWRSRWQIASRELPAATINQFSLKYMIGLMTVIGITLALGRIFAMPSDASLSTSWATDLLRITRAIGVILLGMLPFIAVPILVLSRRPTSKAIAILIAIWIAATCAAVQIVTTFDTQPWTSIACDFFGFQLGGTAAAAITAIALRAVGYRMATRPT